MVNVLYPCTVPDYWTEPQGIAFTAARPSGERSVNSDGEMTGSERAPRPSPAEVVPSAEWAAMVGRWEPKLMRAQERAELERVSIGEAHAA